MYHPIEDVAPPAKLAELNYIYLYPEPRFPGSGFGTGLNKFTTALNTNPEWLREHKQKQIQLERANTEASERKKQTEETQRQLDCANRALAESIKNDLDLGANKP